MSLQVKSHLRDDIEKSMSSTHMREAGLNFYIIKMCDRILMATEDYGRITRNTKEKEGHDEAAR